MPKLICCRNNEKSVIKKMYAGGLILLRELEDLEWARQFRYFKEYNQNKELSQSRLALIQLCQG